MSKPKLLLADDHRMVREGMRNLLEPDYEVVGEAGNGRERVRAAMELRPDVIVADIGMPSLYGIEKEALAGRLYITPTIAKDVMSALMENPRPAAEDEETWSKLTAREREVLQLVAEGHKMSGIGEILHISARTFERHKYSLMDKLKLRTTAELTQYAIKRGLISPP